MEVVAHRAGNALETALSALGRVDMIELDVHVLRGRVEVRHAKVLRPTSRLWEKWFLLPNGSGGVPIDQILAALPPTTSLMIDLKCFTRRSARMIERTIPAGTPVVASSRCWWVLAPFKARLATRVLHSCGSRWQLWWALNLTRFADDHGMCVHEQRLTGPVIAAIQSRTPLLFTWGATSAERCVELTEAGLTGIILDDYSLAPRVQPEPKAE